MYYRLVHQPNHTVCASLADYSFGPVVCPYLADVKRLCYLKDGDPGVEDVVEVDGSLEGIVHTIRAVGVVLVPVDAGGVVSDVGVHVQVALHSSLLKQLWHRVAVPHAIIFGLRADEGVLIVVFSVIVFIGERALGEKRWTKQGLAH